MTTTQYDPNQILMGGGGAPTWKFDGEGVRKVGTITSPPEARQEREYDPNNPGGGDPKFFPSGDPIMGILVEVQTEERDPTRDGDDGRRTFYIEGKRLKDAVKGGVRNAGASGLEVGGVLDVTLTRYDEPGDRRSGRNWHIVYTSAANAQVMGVTADGGTQGAAALPPQQAPAPAPQAYAQPAQQAPQAAPAPQPMQEQPTQAAAPAGPDPAALAAFQAWQAQQQAQQA